MSEAFSTRERIIRAAARQFALSGYEGVPLRVIAEDVGIRAASIFHHFPGGKQELYDTITQELMDLFQARLSSVANLGLGPAETMSVFAAIFWDSLADRPDLASLMLRESFETTSARNADKRATARSFVAVLVDSLRKARDAGKLPDLAPEAMLLVIAAYSIVAHGAPVVREVLYGESATPEEMREHYLSAIKRLCRVD